MCKVYDTYRLHINILFNIICDRVLAIWDNVEYAGALDGVERLQFRVPSIQGFH